MIERKTYLEMCQKVSVRPSGVLGIKKYIPDDLKVVYGDVSYYPVSLNISFDKFGKAVNTAIIHSMKANSTLSVNLKDVCEYVLSDCFQKHP